MGRPKEAIVSIFVPLRFRKIVHKGGRHVWVSAVQRKWIEDSPFIQKLLGDKRAGLFWLFPRLWLGYRWLDAALHKVNNPAWVASGEALKGYWLNAVSIPEAGRSPIAFDWYRSFIQALLDVEAYTWFAKLVAYGEVLVGIALIVGAFTGVAAFFGAMMNWNFMMAGSASTNPVLFLLAIGLILAWKVAGYIGFDYFLLPRLGTPWSRKRPGRDRETGSISPAIE